MENIFKNLKNKKPLIHNITNYVTVNDCANILLACGASPIMADDKDEVSEITTICDGLNINIGTLNSQTIPSMLIAGKKANLLNHPVTLDPVGIGASSLRLETIIKLLNTVKFTVIRGNISEIKTLILKNGITKGVDANIEDKVTRENLDEIISFVKPFAKKMNTIFAITGEIDIVTDGNITYCIYNGNEMMTYVTGTGCQLSSLIAAFISANQDNFLLATATAVCMMGVAGEIAFKRLSNQDGNIAYKNYIIDAIYNMTPQLLKEGAKYEIR